MSSKKESQITTQDALLILQDALRVLRETGGKVSCHEVKNTDVLSQTGLLIFLPQTILRDGQIILRDKFTGEGGL